MPSPLHTPSTLRSGSDTPSHPSILVSLLGVVLTYLLLFSLVTSTRFMPALARWKAGPILTIAGGALSLGPFMLLQLMIVRYLTAWTAPWKKRLALAIGAAAAWSGLVLFASGMRGGTSVLIAPWLNLALIAAAVTAGSLISLAIKEAAVLLPVLLVGALVDYWGVYFGTTHLFVKNAPHIVQTVSATVPTISFGGLPVVTTIGPGDFVFLGIFFTCLYRFHLNVERTFWALAGLLLISLVIVAVFPIPIPALVPMAIAMIGANGRSLRLSRDETFATGYVLLFLICMLAALTLWGPFGK